MLHAVNPESGALVRDGHLKQETLDIRPKPTLDDPDGLDDVGQEPWPITINDDSLPIELREEFERRVQVRDAIKLAATPMRDEPSVRGGRRTGGGRGFLTRGRADRRGDNYDCNDNDEREPYEGDEGYDPGDYPRAQYAPPQYPLPQGYVWAVMPDGQWAPVPTAPVAKPASETETLTALLFKKMIGDGALSEDDRDERAAKRRREEAEWEDRRAREKSEHDERLAMLALQREKLAAEIRALSTPAAPPVPQPVVNVEEVAIRAGNAVRLERAQGENRRLQADARAAQLAAAQMNRPRNPADELRQRVEQIEQIREVARALGMVEPTEIAIEAAGGAGGFSFMDFLNTEAGKIVAERGMSALTTLLTIPPRTVVTQVPQPPAPPPAQGPLIGGYPFQTQGFEAPQGYPLDPGDPGYPGPADGSEPGGDGVQ